MYVQRERPVIVLYGSSKFVLSTLLGRLVNIVLAIQRNGLVERFILL